jgi:hypothetical protein
MVARERACDACGRPYTAKRETSRFCSTACRVAFHEGRPKRVVPSGVVDRPPAERGFVYEATLKQLERLRPEDESLYATALVLALRLDGAIGSAESGSSVAALTKELRATVAACAATAVAVDTVDELSERRKNRQRAS